MSATGKSDVAPVPEGKLLLPVPADAPPMPQNHFKLGKPSTRWLYRNAAGAISEANLTRANLRWANLSRANLRGARLINASLIEASLSGANLKGANVQSATLVDADLTDGSPAAVYRAAVLQTDGRPREARWWRKAICKRSK
jgi:Pentapeptide repeats (8 copies)